MQNDSRSVFTALVQGSGFRVLQTVGEDVAGRSHISSLCASIAFSCPSCSSKSPSLPVLLSAEPTLRSLAQTCTRPWVS